MEKTITSVLLALGGIVVFVFGSPYYRILPTNWNQTYYIAITLVFLGASMVLKRSQFLSRFWPGGLWIGPCRRSRDVEG
jgi:hypothetical protein